MTGRPRLLDLFSGAGGCSVGYHRAGFDVVGVDIEPQPHYPYEFHQADALDLLRGMTTPPAGREFRAGDRWYRLADFDVIHASPPCQRYSDMTHCRPGLALAYPDLLEPTRRALAADGMPPFVVENVAGAPLAGTDDLFGTHGVTLCGQMFGLRLYRHRLFESNVSIRQPHHPRHSIPASKAGHWERGTIISVSGNCAPIAEARAAMGIDWTTRDELAEAIPPAYTEFIGHQLIAHLEAAA